ncbi:hypothetical protein [Magnetovibrio blakemorei]|uniref:Uncharacterized protein n=1 Tax=Magnetovibrio blakemorei TaxID=28181 RepID=A0A1E5Q442_9PROT|nr:hypothetical protein [Magnetovibrio blakemorei]OEJ64645.1 hypothetical protein BEN30_00710 [Magnetovibrio blakemorei]
MGFFGKIFGTEAALQGVVSGVTRGLDALVYTDEEKAGDAAKDRSEARKMVVEWMASTQGQSLARRLLALIITAVWLLQYLTSMALDLVAIWEVNPVNLQLASSVIGERAGAMNGAMMLILGFYFAAPHMGDIAKAALLKFGGKS